MPVVQALRLAPFIVEDVSRALLRRGRRYVAIVGRPGSTAVVTVEGAAEGWASTVPPGGHFENRVAAADAVSVAVVQCPIVHGPAAVRTLGVVQALRLAPFIVEDALRALLRRGRRYVAIVGRPGSTAVVTVEGAAEGWASTVPPGGHFENRVAAADAVGLVWTSALRQAARITAPLLVCVCDRENLIDPKYVELMPAARKARPATTTPIISRSTTRHWSSRRSPTKPPF